MIGIFFFLGALAIPACDATVSTTTAPQPDTTSPATTATSSPSTTSAPQTARTLEVPAHAPPVIDGVLDAGEWHGSTTVTMSDDSSLRWMHTEDVLYVALEAAPWEQSIW